MIPSFEQLCHALQRDRYLVAVLALCQKHQATGYGGVDVRDEAVAGDLDRDDEEEFNSPQLELLNHIDSLSVAEKLSVVPYLRRLGFSVIVWEEDELTLPFVVHFPGCSIVVKYALAARACVYLRSTAPGSLRLRGFMWCMPRLLRWKHRALRYFLGSLEALLVEGVAAHNDMHL